MKVTKENIVLVKIGCKKHVELRNSGYELTGNWIHAVPVDSEPYIQVELTDGERIIYLNEDRFKFPTVYRHVVNEVKVKSNVFTALETIFIVIAILGILALSVVGAVTILGKYVPL